MEHAMAFKEIINGWYKYECECECEYTIYDICFEYENI